MPLQYPVLYRTMDDRADPIVAAAVAQAIGDAATLWSPESFEGVFPKSGFGIAKLKPFDILGPIASHYSPSSHVWIMSVATARTWETYFDGTISDASYVVLTGIFNLDTAPDVLAIKIIADGVEYPVYPVQEIYAWDIASANFSHPVVVRPEKKIQIKVYANTAGQKHLGFTGYTIAKRSYLISEN